jgi:hypothetical protein
MNEKRIQFVIDPKGNFQIKTLEGFAGTSCTEQTKNLEVAIGGVSVADGKTDAYYRPDDEAPVTIGV